MSKIFTIAVGAAGYVLGSRAGRERYEQIKTQANKLWSNPKVQQAASDAQNLAADTAPIVKNKAAAAAHKASSSAKDVANKASNRASHADTSGDESGDDVKIVQFPASPATTTPGGTTHG